jgi:catechol 2,3-dioxygenase-like lactoylglutathione lyase family enzyme
MLSGSGIHTTLPSSDLERSRRFYEHTLGFAPASVSPDAVRYGGSDGTWFVVFPSAGRGTGGHTQIGFTVPDIEAEMQELRERGVSFEAYDMPGFDAATSIATLPTFRAAWFKDPDGNLLGLIQPTAD